MSKFKTIHDEYEESQLNPIHTKSGEITKKHVDKVVDTLPEPEAIKMKMAMMEALVDETAEVIIEENPEATAEEIEQVVEPMVEKAIELAVVPVSFRRNMTAILAAYRRRNAFRNRLAVKAAAYLSESVAEIEEDKSVVDSDVLDSSIETYVDTEGVEVQTTPEDVKVEDTIPADISALIRFKAASDVNSRKATALFANRFSSPILAGVMHEMRYHLPEVLKRRYSLK